MIRARGLLSRAPALSLSLSSHSPLLSGQSAAAAATAEAKAKDVASGSCCLNGELQFLVQPRGGMIPVLRPIPDLDNSRNNPHYQDLTDQPPQSLTRKVNESGNWILGWSPHLWLSVHGP